MTDAPPGRVIRLRLGPPTEPFGSMAAETLGAAFDRPLIELWEAMLAARAEGVRRMVVVVPGLAPSGDGDDAAAAMAAEAARVLAVSAARCWASEGITVNVVALGARAGADELIGFLCSDAAGGVTGQTVTGNGGHDG